MRDLRFRVWDGTGMRQVATMSLGGLVTLVGDAGEPFVAKEVMQFTGLFDRTGEEIWEGDVITDFHGDMRPVVFIDGGFWCVFPDGEKHMPSEQYRKVVGTVYGPAR